jgi:DinB superfamily
MLQISQDLETLVAKTKHDFDNVSDQAASKPAIAGGWSRKQILGHLIDSAANNHQRFVRALLQPEIRLPTYDQEGCVRVERYQELEWAELLGLWASYNHFLAHLLAGVPEAKRSTPCFIGENPVMTLEELAADYVRHMRHHLDQIKART